MAFNFSKFNSVVRSTSVVATVAGLVGVLPAQMGQAQTVVNGAGATFPADLYIGVGTPGPTPAANSWFGNFNSNVNGINTTGAQIRYAPRGSTAGLSAILNNLPPAPATGSVTVPRPYSFSASDVLPSTAQINTYNNTLGNSTSPVGGFGDLVVVPAVASGVAIAYNPSNLSIPTVVPINLTTAQYCGVFNGTITNANQIGGGNVPLTIVRRSDGSGTTQIFSTFLQTYCSGWNRGAGQISAVEGQAGFCSGSTPINPGTVCWPSNSTSASGNPAVVSTINTTTGGIGYAENANRLSDATPPLVAASLANPVAGGFIAPTQATISAAFVNATIGSTTPSSVCRVVVTPKIGDTSGGTVPYPIVSTTNLLFYQHYRPSSNPGNFGNDGGSGVVAALTDLTNEIYTGTTFDAVARNLGYVPLTDTVKAAAFNAASTCIGL